jgi:hypothetical protein
MSTHRLEYEVVATFDPAMDKNRERRIVAALSRYGVTREVEPSTDLITWPTPEGFVSGNWCSETDGTYTDLRVYLDFLPAIRLAGALRDCGMEVAVRILTVREVAS